MSPAEPYTETMHIRRLSYGPDAIAQDQGGKTVFVNGGVPGDTAEIAITDVEKRYSKGHIVNIVQPSAARVEAPCPFVDVCGGCPWGHIVYPIQRAQKRTQVIDSLVRIAHMNEDRAGALVQPCLTPSDPWGYRNKVELGYRVENGKVTIGMHARGNNKLIKVDTCPLMAKEAAKFVKSVTGALSYASHGDPLNLYRIGIRTSERTHSVEVALWGSPSSFPRARVGKILSEAGPITSVVRVMTKGTAKARKIAGVECLAGDGYWSERLSDNTMYISAPSFFQVNTKGAETLIQTVLHYLKPRPNDVAMDLYCGVGTFTIPLAQKVSYVYAVEAYGPAVRDLRRNLKLHHVDNVDPQGGDTGREFPQEDADIIVVDPPRAGLTEDVVCQLSGQPARAIVYVSCDPTTLARDLAWFKEQGTFYAAQIQPIDLFPQSYHVESVCLLLRGQE